MNVKKQALALPVSLTPTGKKWFLIFIVLMLAIVVLAFGFYKRNDGKIQRKNIKPVAWGIATAIPDRIVLSIADDAATTKSVTWRTDTTVSNAVAQIALADAAPRFWKNATEQKAQTELLDATAVDGAETAARYHSVTFSQLQPDTTYAYRVGDGTHWSEWFYFNTASKKAEPFSFLFMGDIQNEILENFAPLVRQAYKTTPDARLMLFAGDIVNFAHSEKQWHEWYTAGGWLFPSVAQVPVMGNHEYGGYTQKEHKAKLRKPSVQWRPQFTLPQNGPEGLKEAAYFFDYQGVRFVALNSNEKLQEQAAWLDDVLKNNTQQWTVVTFHHPVFSGAHHGDNKELRTLWQPLFEKHGVDLVLTGHEHTYSRGQAYMGSKPQGPVYVVSVSGGKMYGFKENAWQEYNARLQRKGENTQLFQVVNVSEQRMEFRSYTATGTLYDAFDLEKAPGAKTATLKEYAGILPPERTHKNTIAYKDKK